MLEKIFGDPEFEFVLPWPPTVNHYHQPVIRGGKPRIVKGKQVREYLKRSVYYAYRQKLAGIGITGQVIVEIQLHPPTLTAYDVDNRPKAILDTLSNVNFWNDDKLVKTLLLDKQEKIRGGAVRVFVWRV